MPALRELELRDVGWLSEAHERELSAAAPPTFSRLTSLSMACDETSLRHDVAPALYLWLGWALHAATQLRVLSLTADWPLAGQSRPSCCPRCLACSWSASR